MVKGIFCFLEIIYNGNIHILIRKIINLTVCFRKQVAAVDILKITDNTDNESEKYIFYKTHDFRIDSFISLFIFNIVLNLNYNYITIIKYKLSNIHYKLEFIYIISIYIKNHRVV